MIEMRKRLMVAQGEIARLKDETRIGWLERALEREQQLRRDAEHALASLRAYCDTQPYPDEVERLREALTRIRDHGETHDEPCWAIQNGDCADVMQEIARSALEAGAR